MKIIRLPDRVKKGVKMSKSRFVTPVFLAGGLQPEDESEIIGGGSAQTGQEPWPVSFEEWQWMYGEDDANDFNNNGILGEWDDYVIWMQKHGWEPFE